MKGSEKQIEWAERIIRKWKILVNCDYQRIVDRKNQKPDDMPKEYWDYCEIGYNKIMAKIDSADDARFIIDCDQRSNTPVGAFDRYIKSFKDIC